MTGHETHCNKFDAIIIGSGFGGTMAARQLINAGLKVLMLERGTWIRRSPENWDLNSAYHLSPYFLYDSPIRVRNGQTDKEMGNLQLVGGPSVFYGGVSLRFREKDFTPPGEIVSDSRACWPLRYPELTDYYREAEVLLNVSGTRDDPTAPPDIPSYPQDPPPIARVSNRIEKAANALGLRPMRLPMAINYSRGNGQALCVHCTTCDAYACAIGAKNDLSSVMLPRLMARGLKLKPRTVVTRLLRAGKRLTGVVAHDKQTGQEITYLADKIILSGGALSSPQLLLASGLADLNPAREHIGRYLMRHINAIVYGIFPFFPDPEKRFHKELGIMDYYFPDPEKSRGLSKVGSLQQFQTPPEGLVRDHLGWPLGPLIAPGLKLLTGFLAIAEDQPQYRNRVYLSKTQKDAYGMPQGVIEHRYSGRDKKALAFLVSRAKKILGKAGALLFYVHHVYTYSHAVGTVRFGEDPGLAPLDPNCLFRGLENLWVVDGSFMPTSAAVNPSLTISANALRVGEHIVREAG
ncbi:MAG: GMC family oxidoreductase [Calditrichaeota bacterium]|nr:GMC family oxidoreductase [Calditrichota bacterium]